MFIGNLRTEARFGLGIKNWSSSNPGGELGVPRTAWCIEWAAPKKERRRQRLTDCEDRHPPATTYSFFFSSSSSSRSTIYFSATGSCHPPRVLLPLLLPLLFLRLLLFVLILTLLSFSHFSSQVLPETTSLPRSTMPDAELFQTPPPQTVPRNRQNHTITFPRAPPPSCGRHATDV